MASPAGANPLDGPVNLAVLRAVIGPDGATYLDRFNASYVAGAMVTVILATLALQSLVSLFAEQERKWMRGVMVLLCTLMVTIIASCIETVFAIAVTDFGTGYRINIGQLVGPGSTFLSALLVQVVYAHRIFVLQRNTAWIAAPIVIIAATAFAVNMSVLVYVGQAYVADRQIDPDEPGFKWRNILNTAAPLLCDLIITATMLWKLSSFKRQAHAQGVGRIIARLIRITIGSNGVTLVYALGVLVVSLRNSPTFLGLVLPLGPLYVIALCTNLSSRQGTRESMSVTHVGSGRASGVMSGKRTAPNHPEASFAPSLLTHPTSHDEPLRIGISFDSAAAHAGKGADADSV